MKCPKCGADIPENARFCGSCGEPIDAPVKTPAADIPEYAPTPAVADEVTATVPATEYAPPAYPEPEAEGAPKRGPFGKLPLKLIIPAAAVVVIVIAAVLATALKPGKYAEQKGSTYISTFDGEVVVIASDGTRTAIDGELENQVKSLDGTRAAFLVDEGGDWYTLYYLDRGAKPRLVAEDVYDYEFAASGTAIVYLNDYDYDDQAGTLALYSGGKTTTITNEAYSAGMWISPDGKTVTYTADYDDGDFEGYYWSGKATSLGKNKEPRAIADGAKYVYYFKGSTFYVQKGAKDDTKTKLGDDASGIIFNRDLSQAVYNSDGAAYITRNGGEKKKLSGELSSFLAPTGTQNARSVYGVASFADTFYKNGAGAIIRVTAKFETVSVAKSVDTVYLAGDGKTLFYLKNESVYSVSGLKANADAKELTGSEDVTEFRILADGKTFYFVNDDDELFYQKGAAKAKQIGEIDSDAYNALAVYKGKTLYFISDGELFSAAGAKTAAVKGVVDELDYVTAGPFSVTISNTDDEYYYSTNGAKFTLLGSD
ncbi:MAG: zinc-ribbon domain-containing protein [Oscillospiraceae bacterium]|jgi:hypothetical protein|nr:zinc-ribbon domain-containing protein [Oscillospiraceae bacterium]